MNPNVLNFRNYFSTSIDDFLTFWDKDENIQKIVEYIKTQELKTVQEMYIYIKNNYIFSKSVRLEILDTFPFVFMYNYFRSDDPDAPEENRRVEITEPQLSFLNRCHYFLTIGERKPWFTNDKFKLLYAIVLSFPFFKHIRKLFYARIGWNKYSPFFKIVREQLHALCEVHNLLFCLEDINFSEEMWDRNLSVLIMEYFCTLNSKKIQNMEQIVIRISGKHVRTPVFGPTYNYRGSCYYNAITDRFHVYVEPFFMASDKIFRELKFVDKLEGNEVLLTMEEAKQLFPVI